MRRVYRERTAYLAGAICFAFLAGFADLNGSTLLPRQIAVFIEALVACSFAWTARSCEELDPK